MSSYRDMQTTSFGGDYYEGDGGDGSYQPDQLEGAEGGMPILGSEPTGNQPNHTSTYDFQENYQPRDPHHMDPPRYTRTSSVSLQHQNQRWNDPYHGHHGHPGEGMTN